MADVGVSPWEISWRSDPRARALADRHYNRQKPGTHGFAPPGRAMVLYRGGDVIQGEAFWITSWPYARYVLHRWAGAWVCSAFRNEGAGLSSDLIRAAVAATVAYYGHPPLRGLVTFLDRSKVQPIKVRGLKTWGRTWELAGFEPDGETAGGLLALRLPLDHFPEPLPARGFTQPHKDFRTAADFLRDAALEAA